MLRAFAALALASATAQHSAATLLPNTPWWEKITVTISGDGKPQACKFESSLKPSSTCDVVGDQAALATSASSGAKDQYTRITFERRFIPGEQPRADALQPGETLLGGQVMALGIDPHGAVKSCKIVAQSGTMRPQYGCDEASAEHFEASVAKAGPITQREGYMTIVVYGHSEHVV